MDTNPTPWLNNTPGLFFTNYISIDTDPTTSLSLPRTLAKSDGSHTKENNNIIALANKAGFHLYWISNQGFAATYDAPATSIGQKANNNVFLKKVTLTAIILTI